MQKRMIVACLSSLISCLGTSLAQDAAHDVKTGTVKTGHAIGQAGRTVERVSTKGFRKAGQGTKVVAEDTAHGTHIVAKDSRKGIKVAAVKTGTGVKDVATK